MKTSELVFVGIGRSVVALNRAAGEQVWATRLKGYDFVNVVLDGGRIFATCCGEIFCLDPVTRDVLWHNPLKGFGTGLATIATRLIICSRSPRNWLKEGTCETARAVRAVMRIATRCTHQHLGCAWR